MIYDIWYDMVWNMIVLGGLWSKSECMVIRGRSILRLLQILQTKNMNISGRKRNLSETKKQRSLWRSPDIWKPWDVDPETIAMGALMIHPHTEAY